MLAADNGTIGQMFSHAWRGITSVGSCAWYFTYTATLPAAVCMCAARQCWRGNRVLLRHRRTSPAAPDIIPTKILQLRSDRPLTDPSTVFGADLLAKSVIEPFSYAEMRSLLAYVRSKHLLLR